MTHLNQLLAIAKDTKTQAGKRFDTAYKAIQKSDPWSGITRTYEPKADDGDRLPGETKEVQVRAQDIIADIRKDLVRMLDVQASCDATNQLARADVVLPDGTTIMEAVPVDTLLFFEKHLTDLNTFFSKMPTLDIADKWEWSTAARAFASLPLETVRTKKVPRNHVLAVATDKHPAQVQVYNEDVIEGRWTTTKYSGAMDGQVLREIIDRIAILRHAVKQAREKANEADVVDVHYGQAIFDYIVGDAIS